MIEISYIRLLKMNNFKDINIIIVSFIHLKIAGKIISKLIKEQRLNHKI